MVAVDVLWKNVFATFHHGMSYAVHGPEGPIPVTSIPAPKLNPSVRLPVRGERTSPFGMPNSCE